MNLIFQFTLLFSAGVVTMAQEPQEVVFRNKAGRVLTRADLKGLSGTVAWEIQSKLPVPPEAKKSHELGRQAGQRGEHQKAISYFEEAAKLAPEWPYPIYDEAFTYLLAGDHSKALALYERVDRLAPRGFFTTKTAVHTLKREQEGKFPVGTYAMFLSLEWVSDQAQRAKIISHLTNQVTDFAPGWKARALTEDVLGKRISLLDRGLASHPDVETRGFLMLNKAAVLHHQGQKAEAMKILGELALDPSAPTDIVFLAKKTISNFLAR